ncbi:MAG: tetratricopeptide repeat protein [Cyanobacteria bacterium SBLK]|nr:tetratricopeptide repeat protein [Cyanobacteria bacterium SBLK]
MQERTRGELKFFLQKNKVQDDEGFIAWLRRFGEKLSEESLRGELGERLRHLERSDIGVVSREAGKIIRKWEETGRVDREDNETREQAADVTFLPDSSQHSEDLTVIGPINTKVNIVELLEPINQKSPDERKQLWQHNLEFANRILESDPRQTFALSLRGYILGQIGRYKEAIADYNKIIKINPESEDAYNNRGLTLKEIGKYEEVIRDYNTAIKINPKSEDAYKNRGLLLGQMERYEEAFADYNTALKIQPNDHIAYNGRANTLHEMKRYEEAIRDYDRALCKNSAKPMNLANVSPNIISRKSNKISPP